MKIQSHLNIKTRKSVRKKLQSHQMLQRFLVKLQRQYCSLTGFLHVLPDFFILGVEKGGTTSLYLYLIQHPSFHSAVTKEINYFNTYYNRGLDWYRVNFVFKWQKYFMKYFDKRDFITGEASVRYFEHPHTPERIKKMNPNSKFIILLRNPVDRAYSQYNMEVRGKYEQLSFEDAIKQEKDRIQGEFEKMQKDNNYYSEKYFHYAYLDRSIYVDKLKRWMKIFPKEQFLIIQSEDFLKNTSEVFNRTLKFLNLPQWKLKEYKQFNKSHPKEIQIEPNFRKQLVDFFKPHNEELFQFLGVNYHWD